MLSHGRTPVLRIAKISIAVYPGVFVFSPGFATSSVLTTNQLPLDPLQPPTITALGSTFYRVDVTDTMPDFQSVFPNFTIRLLAGYATVVLRVTGQNAEKYYVLVSNIFVLLFHGGKTKPLNTDVLIVQCST